MGKRIIVFVNEDSQQKSRITSMLEDTGYQVHFVGNAREALRLVRKVRPKVLITEEASPQRNDFAVCRYLKLDPMISNTPVILLSGKDDSDTAVQALAAGVTDFIPKDAFASENLKLSLSSIFRAGRARA